MYNTGHIEALQEAVNQIKKGRAVFREYCTEDCDRCPLYEANVCGYDLEIDADADISDSLLDNFVEFHNKTEDERDRRNFYDAVGIDPAWYDFNDDRTGEY